MTSLANLRQMALAYLADAQRPENSLTTREDLAFEAVYALCLHAIRSAGADGPATHPHLDTLAYACAFVPGVPGRAYRPAIEHLRTRYFPQRTRHLRALLKLAKTIESATGQEKP